VREAGSSCGEGFIVWVLPAFSSWPPKILSSSRVFCFLARFPEGAQACQAWGCYSAACSGAAHGAQAPVASSSGVGAALRWPSAKMCDVGFVLRVSGYQRGLLASSGKAGAASLPFGRKAGGTGLPRLDKTTSEYGTGTPSCLFDTAYLDVWMNKFKD